MKGNSNLASASVAFLFCRLMLFLLSFFTLQDPTLHSSSNGLQDQVGECRWCWLKTYMLKKFEGATCFPRKWKYKTTFLFVKTYGPHSCFLKCETKRWFLHLCSFLLDKSCRSQDCFMKCKISVTLFLCYKIHQSKTLIRLFSFSYTPGLECCKMYWDQWLFENNLL